MNIEKIAEELALGLLLSDYPTDASYEDVIEMIATKAQDTMGYPLVTFWEPLESADPGWVVEAIQSHKTAIESTIEAHARKAA